MTKAMLHANGMMQHYVTGAGLVPGQKEKVKGQSQVLT